MLLREKEKGKRLYEARARVMKALAHPLRLEVVDLLSRREACVEDIAGRVGAQHSNVSRHLSTLAGAGIVQSRKDGVKVYYSLKMPCVMGFFGCINKVLQEQLNERISLLKE